MNRNACHVLFTLLSYVELLFSVARRCWYTRACLANYPVLRPDSPFAPVARNRGNDVLFVCFLFPVSSDSTLQLQQAWLFFNASVKVNVLEGGDGLRRQE
jgi:hypothetical protein